MKSACSMTNHVLALIAKKYQKVRKEVGGIMRGKILEYEAKTIRNEAIKKKLQKNLRQNLRQKPRKWPRLCSMTVWNFPA